MNNARKYENLGTITIAVGFVCVLLGGGFGGPLMLVGLCIFLYGRSKR